MSAQTTETTATNELEKNYLEQMAILKAEKEAKEKLLQKAIEDNKKLTSDYLNNVPNPANKVNEQEKSAQELSAKLKTKMNKLDYVKTSLQYREAYIKEFGRDPWVSTGENPSVTKQDAEELAATMKQLVDDYGDSPSEFVYRFDSALTEDPSVAARVNRNRK